MPVLKYEKEIVALLVIDPYNDFISEGGKFWGHLKTVAEANNCVSQYAARSKCCSRGEASSFLSAASSIPSGRLCDLEVPAAIVSTNEIVDAIGSLQT